MNGGAAAAAGSVIWLDAIAARLLLGADDSHVYFLGHPIAWTCWLRSHLGVPCPTCGLSRGLVLSLEGRWAEAWRLFPAAPPALAGALVLACALFVLAALQALGRGASVSAGGRLRTAALLWAAGTIAVWMGGWLITVML